MTAPTPSGRHIEFSGTDSQTIGTLGKNMNVVGLYLMFAGILYVVGAVTHVVEGIVKKDVGLAVWGGLHAGVGAIIFLLMGSWTRGASASFRQVVQTQGSDVSHLMTALSNLNKVYALLATFIIMALIILLVLVVIGLILAVTVGMRTS
jgi:hypothetical protein